MAVTKRMEKIKRSLVHLTIITYFEKALIMCVVFHSLDLYSKGDRSISPVFALMIIIFSLEVLHLTTSLVFSAHSTNGKLETEAASKEEKKTENSEEKQKRNNLQEKTNGDADEVVDDLHPTSQIPVTEQKAILNKNITKCEEDSKSAIDKYTKELEEKVEKEKSKYHEERAKWEEIRYILESEIGSLRNFANSVLTIDPWYEPYLTDQHATNPHCTNPYCRSPYCTNQYGTNPNGTYQYGTNAYEQY